MQTDKPGSLTEKFGAFGAAPTDQLWNSIATKLDQDEKKKRGAFWWWFGGIAAGLLLIVSVYQVGYHFGKRAEGQYSSMVEEDDKTAEQLQPNDPTTKINTHTDASLMQNATADQETNALNEVERDQSAQPQIATVERMRQNESFESGLTESSVQKQDGAQLFVRPEIENQSANTGSAIEQNTSDELAGTPLNSLPQATISLLANSGEPSFNLKTTSLEKRKLPGRWELGFTVGTALGYEATSQKMETLSPQLPANLTDENFDLGISSIDGSGQENSLDANGIPPTVNQIDASIKRPVSVDFTIARTVGKRWSFSSGLGFNYFTAVNAYKGSVDYETRAAFLSVSFPIVVDFDFVKRRRFEFSVGSGVMAEFPFLAKETTSMAPSAAIKESAIFNNGFMGAAIFRTGFYYNVNERLKIGLNPGLRYYFRQSLQSEMPVLKRNNWVGVSVGMTWDL